MKKVNKKNLTLLATIAFTLIGVMSCTKLNQTLYGSQSLTVNSNGAPNPGSLASLYNNLNGLSTNQGDWFAMEEHTTDELLGPTRGTDWDDFGTWRKLHLHTWDGTHNQVVETWNNLNGWLYAATLVAETATGQTKAEAQFVRAFNAYIICDLYGQVPYVPATAGTEDPGTVLTRSDAVDFILKDLDAAIAALPSYTQSTRDKATKEAAEYLEAKVYLNKAVYKNDPTKPGGPFTFDPADMNKVIALCDAIASNGSLAISPNYWDNFTWQNGSKSTELIFTREQADGGNVQWPTYMGHHYNQTPSGWNGFTTLSDFYNSFDATDVRRSASIPGFTDVTGDNAGLLVGQQVGPSNGIGSPLVNLKDRSGNPLIFTSDVSLFFSTESKGIRTMKYPMDPAAIQANGGSSSANDFVFFRFADVRLMKAEAILRGGSATGGETPLSIVNGLLASRTGAAPLASVDLPTLLVQRSKELYLEGWRRNDMIRFGTFNAPVGQRSVASDPSRCVFPIPLIALSSNPNLKQNFGY